MLKIAAAVWIIVVNPSNSNREVELPTSYASEKECHDAQDARIAEYVVANSLNARRTRGVCKLK
jgi:hypothetical protein